MRTDNLPPFGRRLRELRAGRGRTLAETAPAFGVSVAFLAAVETGAKKAPADWPEKAAEIFGLGGTERASLLEAAALSAPVFEIRTAGASEARRRAAKAFADAFPRMGDAEADAVRELIEKKGKGEGE